MSIKTGLFFFLTFCFIITLISDIIDHYCIMENSKKKNQIKNTLKTLYPKNHKIMEILRTGSIGSNFTGSYKKRVYLHYQYLWLPDLPCWRLTFRGSYHIVTWHLIKWPYLDYVTVWTFYISAFTRLMATNLGRMLTTGRRFSMQTLKSSLTCVFFLGMLFALMLICRIFLGVYELCRGLDRIPVEIFH